ncbi:unnamed protein product [Paramecium pentaurelia]|uniref:Uncharacterized protein n=1 Tax=Paramecium pentaurelia TaxID=43138 RepID=A0A8S1VF59_9CILI|nr:unnamed protein product [Paramecium pentaurelia]
MSVIRDRHPLTSLNQLQNLFGKSKQQENTQNVCPEKVRGASKPKQKTEGSRREVSNVQKSQYTLQSQKLYTNHLDNIKSSRAFNVKSQDLLLSPERIESLQQDNKVLEIQNDKKRILKQSVEHSNDQNNNNKLFTSDDQQKKTEQSQTIQLKNLIQSKQQRDTNNNEILEKQKNSRREKHVAQILYDDSRTRQQKNQLTSQSLATNEGKLSEISQQWFIQRFIKDFYYFLSNTENVKKSWDYSKIYENDFQQILQGLGFGESKELWNDFTNGSYILSRNILIVLLAILNVPVQQIPLYIPKDDEQVPMASHYKNDENGNLILSTQDCIEIHNKYKQLYLNTKLNHGNGQRRNIEKSKSPPQVINLLSNRSRDMAIKKKNNLNINEWFAQQEQKKKDNIEKLKNQLEQSEETKQIKQTIRPLAIDLTSLSKPIKKQQDKSTIDVEFESQQQFCTFSPQINPIKNFPISTASTQYDIDQQAKRLREARLRQKTVEKLKSTGNTTNNESRTQIKLQTEQSMSQEPKCKKIKSKPIFLNFPILYIDVKIDDAKTVRLPIFNGDNPENLATKFAIDNNLDNSLEERLKDLLEEQINSVQEQQL